MRSLAFRSALLLTLASMALAASAQNTYTFVGTHTAASPTFHRPDEGYPPAGLSDFAFSVRYAQLLFTVDATGTYAFAGNAVGYDGFGVLYRGPLNPPASIVNVLVAGDGGAGAANYGFTYALTAGTTYALVSTMYYLVGADVTFADTITGPGNVQAVPEPASMAALGLGAVAVLRRRKRA